MDESFGRLLGASTFFLIIVVTIQKVNGYRKNGEISLERGFVKSLLAIHEAESKQDNSKNYSPGGQSCTCTRTMKKVTQNIFYSLEKIVSVQQAIVMIRDDESGCYVKFFQSYDSSGKRNNGTCILSPQTCMMMADLAISTSKPHDIALSTSSTDKVSSTNLAVLEILANGVEDGHILNLRFFPLLYGIIKVGAIILLNKNFDVSKVHHETNSIYSSIEVSALDTLGNHSTVALNQIVESNNIHVQSTLLSCILELKSCQDRNDSLDNLIKILVRNIEIILNPELLSIFICDHIQKEVVLLYSKDKMEGLTMPFGKGFVGIVATEGQSIRTNNAYEDDRFFNAVDKTTGLNTKSVLCVPVTTLSDKNCKNDPVLIIQAINKVNKMSFTVTDEDALKVIAKELSPLLRWRAMELSDHLRVSIDSSEEEKEQHVEPLMKKAVSSSNLPSITEVEKQVLKEYGAKSRVPRFIVSVDGEKNLKQRPTSPSRTSDHGVNGSNFDPFLCTDGELVDHAIEMFETYGLIKNLNVPVAALKNFLTKISSKYRPDIPFHNFKHAFGTMHLSYIIMQKGAGTYLNDLEKFALLLAAISHDVDHTGRNNAFEIAIASDIAKLHGYDAVLERHHLATTLQILTSEEIEKSGLLEGLSSIERQELFTNIARCILGTDMSKHFSMVEELAVIGLHGTETYLQGGSSGDFMTHVLHCADIGAQTQSNEVAIKWTEALTREFSAQAQEEARLGIPVTIFMYDLDNESSKLKLQISFIRSIVMPLWSALASCFPGLEVHMMQVERNLKMYIDRYEVLKKS